jgi:hypothetical protein
MQKSARLKRSDNFVSRRLGGEVVLIPINQTGLDVQKIYSLNTTAAQVWELLEMPYVFDEVVAIFEEKYSAPEGIIRNEMQQLFEQLTEDKFLVVLEE